MSSRYESAPTGYKVVQGLTREILCSLPILNAWSSILPGILPSIGRHLAIVSPVTTVTTLSKCGQAWNISTACSCTLAVAVLHFTLQTDYKFKFQEQYTVKSPWYSFNEKCKKKMHPKLVSSKYWPKLASLTDRGARRDVMSWRRRRSRRCGCELVLLRPCHLIQCGAAAATSRALWVMHIAQLPSMSSS